MTDPHNVEEWRTVQGFPLYEVSSHGRVRSYLKKVRQWRNPEANPGVRRVPKLLEGTVTPKGYTAFILRRASGGKPVRRTAHRLVALAFLPPPLPRQTDVCHNDGNPANNHINNLRWDTHHANQMDMRKHETMQDGERCITAKLTEEQAQDIRRMAAGRGGGRAAAAKYGISYAQVSRIKNGTRWAYLAAR